MIQQQHIVNPYPTPEVHSGKSLAVPGLGANILQIVQMYARGSMEEKAIGYYEKEGMEVPDFGRMSYIERLEALSEYRKQVKQAQGQLESFARASEAKEKEAILQKTVKQKVDEELEKQRKSER